MSINEDRQKFKNLRRESRASAFFIDLTNPYRTLELRATVEIEANSASVFVDRVGAKYSSHLCQMDEADESRAMATFVIQKARTFG